MFILNGGLALRNLRESLRKDKSGKVFTLNADDYNPKASEILRVERTYEFLNSDPLQSNNHGDRSKIRQLSTKYPDKRLLKRF